jgi:hypothetical protein
MVDTGREPIGFAPDSKERVMRYVTVESIAYCVASRHPARFRLTYEVKPLREGMESWFLLSMEKIQTLLP